MKTTEEFDPFRFCQTCEDPEEAGRRHLMIATEAYYRAERRAFASGHEIDDWIAAENSCLSRIVVAVPE